jgi:hypothetical protein
VFVEGRYYGIENGYLVCRYNKAKLAKVNEAGEWTLVEDLKEKYGNLMPEKPTKEFINRFDNDSIFLYDMGDSFHLKDGRYVMINFNGIWSGEYKTIEWNDPAFGQPVHLLAFEVLGQDDTGTLFNSWVIPNIGASSEYPGLSAISYSGYYETHHEQYELFDPQKASYVDKFIEHAHPGSWVMYMTWFKGPDSLPPSKINSLGVSLDHYRSSYSYFLENEESIQKILLQLDEQGTFPPELMGTVIPSDSFSPYLE